MKILYVTDTHLGARQGSKIFRELFREYYKDILFPYIEENNIDTVIHLGDFFDHRVNVTLEDINYVIREFIPMIESGGVDWHFIPGNHDVAYKDTNDITSLTLFKDKKHCFVHDDPFVMDTDSDVKIALVPWINNNNYNAITDFIHEHANDNTVLGGHFEVIGFKLLKSSNSVCEQGLEQSIFKGYKKVLSGHFHHNSTIGNIEYIGSLFHLNWADYGDWRGFTVYDTITDEWEKVENKKNLFVEVNYNNQLTKDYNSDTFKDKFVKLIVDDEYKKLELKDAVHFIEQSKPIKLQIDERWVLKQASQTTDLQTDVSGDVYDYLRAGISEPNILKLAEDLFNRAYEEMTRGEI